MFARTRSRWVSVRDSLWFLPAVITMVAGAFALLLIGLEREEQITLGAGEQWILGGGPEGARNVVNTIAGSLMTVTGVVFSITIVALQLASTQFSPRVLRNFTANRSNQVVLGIFIGTFTFALLVLRSIRSGTDEQEAFVPAIATATAVLLAVISIGALIFFINHAARVIQVSVIVDHVRKQTLHNVARLFPAQVGIPEPGGSPSAAVPDDPPAVVHATEAGYLQDIDEEALFELAEDRRLTIRMERLIGEFLIPGETLVSVWPADAVDEEVRDGIHLAFVLGPERTPEQDVEFGIIEIADIAVKALSPGINDPSTAMNCIDRLGEVLAALGGRTPPVPIRKSPDGQLRLIALRPRFSRAVELAFDQIRHYGADNPAIVGKMLDIIGRVAVLVPEQRRASLAEQAEAILHVAREAVDNPVDRETIERAGERALAKIGPTVDDAPHLPRPVRGTARGVRR